ncbi:hypothetical protein GQ457_07G000880 [Hibiscus cannabinus]
MTMACDLNAHPRLAGKDTKPSVNVDPTFLRPKSRIGESSSFPLLSIVGLCGRISRGLRDGGLPCGECQRFESAYLQLVNLAKTKIYDNLSISFSSTLGWHNLKVKLTGGKESKSDFRSSGEQNWSSLNRENGVVGE